MQQIEKIGNSFWYMTPVSETDRPILGMVVGKEKNVNDRWREFRGTCTIIFRNR